MTEYVFVPPPIPSVEIAGSRQRFPVHRIYCVGRNYADHVREMGNDLKEPPIFFSKPADAIVANGAAVPVPPRTDNFHYEVELVIAVGGSGRNISSAQALDHVFGYAVGNDLTRRDMQSNCEEKGPAVGHSERLRCICSHRCHSSGITGPRRAWQHLAQGQW